MNKLSFRARTLDANKPVAVYRGNEVPDQLEFGAANRAIVEMPTGMEKEEETEHHLQRALNAQQVYGTSEVLAIPIPDMDTVGVRYNKLYGSKAGQSGFRPPKQYIHVQPPGMEQEIPEYDMDSEDEAWLARQVKSLRMDIAPIKLENMLDRLEKGSGQMVVTLPEAKALLKEDDDLTMAVYDYWLNKRLALQHPLIPQVRSEKRDGSSTNNPYVAFRRRTEKMQTRKNRKNDESSYEKMLKLKKDLNKALLLLEMLKRREKSKKELLRLTVEVVEQRYRTQDWDGSLLAVAKTNAKRCITAFVPPMLPEQPCSGAPSGGSREWDRLLLQEDSRSRRKREYKKRKHKPASSYPSTTSSTAATPRVDARPPGGAHGGPLQPPLYAGGMRGGLLLRAGVDAYSSAEESAVSGASGSDTDVENNPDGVYAFKRRAGCTYLAAYQEGPGGWPWSPPSPAARGVIADPRYRYSLTSLSEPPRLHCIGYARRRIGRGGRVLLDRASTPWDDQLLRFNASQPLTSSSGPCDTVTPGVSADDMASSCVAEQLRTHAVPHYRQVRRLLMAPGAIARHDSRGGVEASCHGGVTVPFGASEPARIDDAVSRRPTLDHLVAPDVKRSRTTTHSPLDNDSLLVVDDDGLSTLTPAGDSLGLSTLPADSILQLNYPLPAPLAHPHNPPVPRYATALSHPPASNASALHGGSALHSSASHLSSLHASILHPAAAPQANLIAAVRPPSLVPDPPRGPSGAPPGGRSLMASAGGVGQGQTTTMKRVSSAASISYPAQVVLRTSDAGAATSHVAAAAAGYSQQARSGALPRVSTAPSIAQHGSAAGSALPPNVLVAMTRISGATGHAAVPGYTAVSGHAVASRPMQQRQPAAPARIAVSIVSTSVAAQNNSSRGGATGGGFPMRFWGASTATVTHADSNNAEGAYARNVITFTRPSALVGSTAMTAVARTNRGAPGGTGVTASTGGVAAGAAGSAAATQQQQQQAAMLKLGSVIARTNNALTRDTRDERISGTSNEAIVAMEVT